MYPTRPVAAPTGAGRHMAPDHPFLSLYKPATSVHGFVRLPTPPAAIHGGDDIAPSVSTDAWLAKLRRHLTSTYGSTAVSGCSGTFGKKEGFNYCGDGDMNEIAKIATKHNSAPASMSISTATHFPLTNLRPTGHILHPEEMYAVLRRRRTESMGSEFEFDFELGVCATDTNKQLQPLIITPKLELNFDFDFGMSAAPTPPASPASTCSGRSIASGRRNRMAACYGFGVSFGSVDTKVEPESMAESNFNTSESNGTAGTETSAASEAQLYAAAARLHVPVFPRDTTITAKVETALRSEGIPRSDVAYDLRYLAESEGVKHNEVPACSLLRPASKVNVEKKKIVKPAGDKFGDKELEILLMVEQLRVNGLL